MTEHGSVGRTCLSKTETTGFVSTGIKNATQCMLELESNARNVKTKQQGMPLSPARSASILLVCGPLQLPHA